MNRLLRTIVPFVALSFAAWACSEKDSPPISDAAIADATTDAEPVPNTDVTLDPPNPGFQLEVPAFDVPQGSEVQDCYFMAVPENTLHPGEPLYIDRFTIRQNPGTHHMNVFRVGTVKDLGGHDGDVVRGDAARKNPCWKSANWSDWPLVVNSQASTGDGMVDWQLPDGVAQKFEPGELLMLQTHYVNASTQHSALGRGKVLVNFHQIEADAVQHEMGTLFATNQNIRICPGETKEFTKTCNFAKSEPLHIIAANGHFHSRGTDFRAYSYDAVNDQRGEMFYESLVWDDPPMARDLDVTVPPMGGIEYSCGFHAEADDCGNADDECCYTFGGSVDTQEHCNLFLYYYPKQVDFGCF